MNSGFPIILVLAIVAGGIAFLQSGSDWMITVAVFIGALGAGAALLASLVSFLLRRDQVDNLASMRLFERDLGDRLAKLEHRLNVMSENHAAFEENQLDGEGLEKAVASVERKLSEVETYLASGKFVALDNQALEEAAMSASATAPKSASGAVVSGVSGQKSADVINLGDAAARKNKAKPSNAQGEEANGKNQIDPVGEETPSWATGKIKLQPLLQPIVSLPEKGLEFYEAFARIKAEDGKFLDASEFLPAFQANGRIREVDLEILQSVILLIRKLQREKRDQEMPGVFWNVSAASIAKEEDFVAVRDALKANATLASTIIPELDIVTLENASPQFLKELSSLSRLGYRFSMDIPLSWHGFEEGFSGRHISKVVSRIKKAKDVFPQSFVKVPAQVLLSHQEASAETMIEILLPLLEKAQTQLIATHVEREEQAIGLIDHYVAHAQGNFICPPKPVKSEVTGGAGAASAG